MRQLDLFPELINESKDYDTIRNEWEKTRRALFREISVCKRNFQELSHEFQILKLNICKGKIPT